MAGSQTVSTPDQTAAPSSARSNDLLLIEVAKLQSDGEYIKRDLGELRTEMREIRADFKEFRGEVGAEIKTLRAEVAADSKALRTEVGNEFRLLRTEVSAKFDEFRADIGGLRDRMTRLEERVAHLPGKGVIAAVVTTAMVLIGGVTTIVPRLQILSAPAGAQQPPSAIR